LSSAGTCWYDLVSAGTIWYPGGRQTVNNDLNGQKNGLERFCLNFQTPPGGQVANSREKIWRTQKPKNVERMPMTMVVHEDNFIQNQSIAKIIFMAV
jgi:hypothetical protein